MKINEFAALVVILTWENRIARFDKWKKKNEIVFRPSFFRNFTRNRLVVGLRRFTTACQSPSQGTSSSMNCRNGLTNQSAYYGRRIARSSSRPPLVCYPFLLVAASLDSITDTLTITGDCAYVNGLHSWLKTSTFHTKDYCSEST